MNRSLCNIFCTNWFEKGIFTALKHGHTNMHIQTRCSYGLRDLSLNKGLITDNNDLVYFF